MYKKEESSFYHTQDKFHYLEPGKKKYHLKDWKIIIILFIYKEMLILSNYKGPGGESNMTGWHLGTMRSQLSRLCQLLKFAVPQVPCL